MHALVRSGATATGAGGAVAHSSVANAQRGTNAHPGSGDTALGTDPASALRHLDHWSQAPSGQEPSAESGQSKCDKYHKN